MSQTVLITGCSTGFGKLTAKLFHEKGWNVIATMRSPQNETELNKLDNVLVTKLDVTDNKSVIEAVNLGRKKFGSIDVLVNNAAGNFISPTERLSNRAFDIIINIVLKGTYNCTLAFGKDWIKKKQNGKKKR